jgi:hypothetical protein
MAVRLSVSKEIIAGAAASRQEMVASKAIESEIQANRSGIARLKREIFGVDKTHKSRYIKEFNSEFRSYRRIETAEEAIECASRSDIVYFGDYHPLDASQELVLHLMKELSARGRTVVLALEMLYVHQQECLDRWMKGTINEDAFLEAIDYKCEWGFSWPSYRRIFELAKNPFIPIFGIDSEPRDHLRYIRRRDRLAARRIGTIRRFFPDSLILVVVGESHLASNHLPREVRAVLGGRFSDTVIVQNIDDIYWRLLRTGREDAEAVAIDGNRHCIFTTSPMLKYEAYRRIIDVWSEGEEADRHTPFLHEMIEAIHSFLRSGRKRPLVSFPNGRKEPLEAILPEVECRATYHAFSSYLRSRRVSTREIVPILGHLKREGMRYVPGINVCLIARFDPSRAVREAARFVLHALRGDVGEVRAKRRSVEDEFFGSVIEEALVCFAAKVVDPSRSCLGNDSPAGASKPGRAAMSLRKIASLPLRRRLLHTSALGGRLGEALHAAFHEGRVPRREIEGLFGARLVAPGSAKQLHSRLTKAVRGRPGATHERAD